MFVPGPNSVTFHYLSLVNSEYRELLDEAAAAFAARGLRLERSPKDYTVLGKVDWIREQLGQGRSIIEMPLHTAARLFQDASFAAGHKIIASGYTFTTARPKVVLYHYADNPRFVIKRLVCSDPDSISTRMFLYYAIRDDWPYREEIATHLVSTGSQEGISEDALYGRHGREGRRQRSWLVSGADHQRAMGNVAAEMNREVTKPGQGTKMKALDDIYAGCKQWWAESLASTRRALPDLPGAVIVAPVTDPDDPAPFFQPLVDAIAAWSSDADQQRRLREVGMGPPHLGTPIDAVATVIYMDLMARAGGRLGDACLGYDHFLLTNSPKLWEAHRDETARALRFAGKYLYRRRTRLLESLELAEYLGDPSDPSAAPAARLARFDGEHLRRVQSCLDDLPRDGGAVLRAKTRAVLSALAEAHRALDSWTPRARKRSMRARVRYTAVPLPPHPGAPGTLRIRSDSLRSSDEHRASTIRRLLGERKSQEAPPALALAAEVCAQGQISNQEIKRRHGVDNWRTFSWEMRVLCRFIESRKHHQAVSLRDARVILHPDDYRQLKAAVRRSRAGERHEEAVGRETTAATQSPAQFRLMPPTEK
jgi:hypothetical protein